MNNKLHKRFSTLMADTYGLYLKTQNYHWHVKGPNFKTLHILFEEQYTELADAVDDLAERIVSMGGKSPATFSEFSKLTTLSEGKSDISANDMVVELTNDHQKIIKDLYAAIKEAQEVNDEGSIALLSERIALHEKTHWMLKASQE